MTDEPARRRTQFPAGLPLESGYTNGFTMFAVVAAVAVGATLLIPARVARWPSR